MRSKRADYSILMRNTEPLRAHFRWVLLLGIATNVLAVLQPWPMQMFIDYVLGGYPIPRWLASLPGAERRDILIGYLTTASFLLPAIALLIESSFVLRSTELGARCAFLMARELFGQL